MVKGWWVKIWRSGVGSKWGTRQCVPRESLGEASGTVGKDFREFGF